MTPGMTLVELEENASETAVREVVSRAMTLTPAGRQLCVVFPLPTGWEPSLPFEAWITDEVLGAPRLRAEPHEWIFTGNITIRICRIGKSRRDMKFERGVLIFRRAGEMTYVRRGNLDKRILKRAELTALHPVFTRDVANNVWHIPVKGEIGRIRNRLQALFTWPDEVVLLVGQKNTRRLKWKPLDLDEDLIGVPQKYEYRWM